MKGYKIFKNDWTCRDFQYEVGKTYEFDGEISLCNEGFHFCQDPVDCLRYYESVQWNKFAEVEALGKTIEANDDSKCVTNKLKIVKELLLKDFISLCKSNGVNRSYGVNRSNGVNWSDGVNRSNGVNVSGGVNRSYGVNGSYGIYNSYGVDNALFLANKERTYTIFGVAVNENKYREVYSKLINILNGWKPTFNNLKSLYIKNGSEWVKTPIPNAKELSKKETWQDMPKDAINYLKSLTEFDAEMFFEITGIEV